MSRSDCNPRASQGETDEETGAQEARRDSTEESCQQARTYSADGDRRRDASKVRDTQNLISGSPEIQSPSPRRRPQTEHTKAGDRKPDSTRPSDRPSDRRTDRGATHLADLRFQRLLELAGAAKVGACAGCGGGLRRHLGVSADPRAWAVTRGGQARRWDREAFNDIWS